MLSRVSTGAAVLAVAVSTLAGFAHAQGGNTSPGSAGAVVAGAAQNAPAATGVVQLPADNVIAIRQAGYGLMAGTLAGMKQAVAEKSDVKPYAEAAKAMAEWASASPNMFPDGTQHGHDTHARDTIWSDHAGFVKAAANFGAAAQKLQQAASAGDKQAFAAAFGGTAQACGACHKDYRSKL